MKLLHRLNKIEPGGESVLEVKWLEGIERKAARPWPKKDD